VGSWPDIIADPESLTETEIEYDGKRFIVRSAPRPTASPWRQASAVLGRSSRRRSAPVPQ